MSEAKFTPGPWSLCTEEHGWVLDAAGVLLADCYIIAPGGNDTERDAETVNANAALVAAAPDLYEALRDLLEARRIGGIGGGAARAESKAMFPSAWEKARAALAKARGEQ